MKLTDFDLRQMDEKYLAARTPEQLMRLSVRLLEDLKQARDQLNRTPNNSSMPPSSQAPWDKPGVRPDEDEAPEAAEQDTEPSQDGSAPEKQEPQDKPGGVSEARNIQAPGPRKRQPGRQPGAQGHGRTQHIEATQQVEHRPPCCASCGEGWGEQTPMKAYTAYDEIDLAEPEPGRLGLRLMCTRHTLHTMTCGCGHQTRAQPYRADDDTLWESVELSQWRLVGPRLAALIVYFGLRMRLSHERIKELLWELFTLALAKGTIGQTIREAGRAAAPLLDEIAAEIESSGLVHADETSWPEGRKLLWLWTLVTQHAVLFLIGLRTNEMIDNALSRAFKGILMSDGYAVYRKFLNRLRCWAHLSRKLRGLAQSTDYRVSRLGGQLQAQFLALQNAVYAARASPTAPLPSVMYAAEIAAFKTLCQQHHDDLHSGVRAVAREFLLDWDVIVRQLAEPHLPLTNNEAERMLRHWVIARHISHGTRTPSGSRAFSVLASVIETCRRRKACSRTFLANVITNARRNSTLPSLPCPLSD
jgi:transposase